MTHNQRVLDLLSDGEPHSHHEVYDLRVVAHSRIAALRKAGHTIECWKEDGVYWYRLNDGLLADGATEHPPLTCCSGAEPIVEADGQYAIDLEGAAA